MGTFCAPSCRIPISKMFHSLRLVMEITAILSLVSTPRRNRPLLTALALSTYCWVEVATHFPLYLVTRDFSRGWFSNWWYGNSKRRLIFCIVGFLLTLQIRKRNAYFIATFLKWPTIYARMHGIKGLPPRLKAWFPIAGCPKVGPCRPIKKRRGKAFVEF